MVDLSIVFCTRLPGRVNVYHLRLPPQRITAMIRSSTISSQEKCGTSTAVFQLNFTVVNGEQKLGLSFHKWGFMTYNILQRGVSRQKNYQSFTTTPK